MADICLFAVVEFTDELTVSVVPKTWLVYNRKKETEKCYYPCFGGEKAKRDLIKSLATPKKSWKAFPCRVFQFCQTYDEALQIEDEAQYRSSFDSEQDDSQRSEESQATSLTVPDQVNPVVLSIKNEPTNNVPEPRLYYLDHSGIGANLLVEPVVNASSASNANDEIDSSTTTNELKLMILGLEKKIDNYQSFVASQFVKIGEDINILLFANPAVQNEQVNNQSVSRNFPVDSDEQLRDIEKYLESDANKELAISFFSSVGGIDVPSITRRVLSRIFTKQFAERVNYSGQNGKTKFSTTLLYNVVKCSILRHKAAEGSTQRLVEQAVQNWFRYAKGRNRHGAGQQTD